MSVSGFFHGGITVADMDRSLSFYVDGLELEVLVDRVASDAYLGEVLPRDPAVDPGKSLAAVCQQHGWKAFRPELEAAVLGMFSAEATYQSSAAPLITRLNHGLFRRAIEARFLTTFYGILAPDGSFTYCNAGHNPPVLVMRDGVRRLETGGVVLGLFEHAAFDEETLRLAPGDFIVAFSDGVSEALNACGEEFSDERLLACLSANRGGGPQEILEALLQEVRAFCGDAPQSDDVTIVMVRYDGQSRESGVGSRSSS